MALRQSIVAKVDPRHVRPMNWISSESPSSRTSQPWIFGGNKVPFPVTQGRAQSTVFLLLWDLLKSVSHRAGRAVSGASGFLSSAGHLSLRQANQRCLRMLRRSTGRMAMIAMNTTVAIPRATSGLQAIKLRPPSTIPSSARLRPILVNGSGEVFATRRVPALARCEERAILPARRAAVTSKTGLTSPIAATARAAAPSGRMKVCTESQAVSIQGILSAKNSNEYKIPAKTMTIG